MSSTRRMTLEIPPNQKCRTRVLPSAQHRMGRKRKRNGQDCTNILPMNVPTESTRNLLLQLPGMCWSMVLQFLPLRDLMFLRECCSKTLKADVDNKVVFMTMDPRTISSFIDIMDGSRMEDICDGLASMATLYASGKSYSALFQSQRIYRLRQFITGIVNTMRTVRVRGKLKYNSLDYFVQNRGEREFVSMILRRIKAFNFAIDTEVTSNLNS